LSSYNIYGINWYEINQESSTEEQNNRCPLCGGVHDPNEKLPAYLVCPYCKKKGEYKVSPHCPGGVSHGEVHRCPHCNREVFLVVYYDGEVIIKKKEV